MHQETAGQSDRQSSSSASQHATAVMSTMEESVALFFRLRAVLEEIHGHSPVSGSMRGVMRELRRYGPLTVPQMARRRPVSRQHIQAIVNELQRAGLVTLVENPRHKRSRLVGLTPEGEAAMDEIIEREHSVLNEIDIPVSIEDLEQANETLSRVREMLEQPAWRKTVRAVLYPDGPTPQNPWLDETEDVGGDSSSVRLPQSS
jgi:DNA-binding MarR family transcriptional regulator